VTADSASIVGSCPLRAFSLMKQRRLRLAGSCLVAFVNFIFTALILALLASGTIFYFLKESFYGPGPLATEKVILVEPGTSFSDISQILARDGFTASPAIFSLGVYWEGKTAAFKAGEYAIPAHASMRDIMDILVEGKSIDYAITVPEGLTIAQVFARLAANDILVGDLPDILPPEGSLMTDTVRFYRGTTREEIVRRLVAEQKKLIEEIWQKRDPDLPLQTINEFVTLASIVEKETGVASERARVAAVFYNRLAKNMRLQSDPTVIYGIFGSAGKPAERPIYRSDLDRETPFNTYKINGLPPSPIANPGRAALEAVANPPKTDEFYFVADGTGGHVFAKTLDEHNRNVRAWRALERSRTLSE